MVTTGELHGATKELRWAESAGARQINRPAAQAPYESDAAGATQADDHADRWSREARRLRGLAAARGIELDGESLAHYDMRDLLSLGLRLREQQGFVPTSSGLRYRAARQPRESIVSGDPERMLLAGPMISTHQSGLSFTGVLAVIFAALLPLAAPLIALALLVALAH